MKTRPADFGERLHRQLVRTSSIVDSNLFKLVKGTGSLETGPKKSLKQRVWPKVKQRIKKGLVRMGLDAIMDATTSTRTTTRTVAAARTPAGTTNGWPHSAARRPHRRRHRASRVLDAGARSGSWSRPSARAASRHGIDLSPFAIEPCPRA